MTESMIVPPDKIPEEQLKALLESFVLREGTDYGIREFSLEEKYQQLRQPIASGELLIVFDTAAETFTLMPKQEYAQRLAADNGETSY